MKITILNGCNFTPEHIDRLKAIGKVNIFNDTKTEAQAIERIGDSEIVVADCFFTPLNKKVLSSSNKLKFIVLNSTGFDLVDLEAASANSIMVANTPNLCTDSVAEHAIALMFAVNRKLLVADESFRNNPLQPDADPFSEESRRKYFGFDVRSKTMGILGFGNIGKRVSELALGLGMKVIAYNRTPKTEPKEVRFLSFDEVMKTSDVISLNMALSDDTRSIINSQKLALMKEGSIIINTARGGLIDTDDLYDVLKKNKIYGAGLDTVVLNDKSHPILKLNNVVFSPHIAAFTNESLSQNLPRIVVENIEAFVKGEPINIVN